MSRAVQFSKISGSKRATVRVLAAGLWSSQSILGLSVLELNSPGGGPEAVAQVIERAITARRPKTRYPVTPSAHLLLAQRAVMPDRLGDVFLGTLGAQPR